jgi:cytochrome P450
MGEAEAEFDKFFAATDPREHAFLRKRVATAYTMSTILSLEYQIQGIANQLWVKLHEIARTGTAIDLQIWANFFAFDVVGQLGLGGPLGFVQRGEDVDNIMKSTHSFFYLQAGMGYIPGQMWWFENPVSRALLKWFGPSSTQGANTFFSWLFEQVSNRMAEGDAGDPKQRTRDMLDYFISMRDPDGSTVQLPGVLIEGGNLIGAGADTTAIAIAVVMGQLLTHPAHYARVQKEVDEVFKRYDISEPSGLTYLIAEKIPFLNACVKEATRLYPSILWQLPRHAPTEGITVAGYYIPPSATLSMSPIAQNRCREIFGDDADEWKPERFIAGEKGTSPERIREMDKYNVTVRSPLF